MGRSNQEYGLVLSLAYQEERMVWIQWAGGQMVYGSADVTEFLQWIRNRHNPHLGFLLPDAGSDCDLDKCDHDHSAIAHCAAPAPQIHAHAVRSLPNHCRYLLS